MMHGYECNISCQIITFIAKWMPGRELQRLTKIKQNHNAKTATNNGDLQCGINQRTIKNTLKWLPVDQIYVRTGQCSNKQYKTAHNSFLSAPSSVRGTVSSLHLPKHDNQFGCFFCLWLHFNWLCRRHIFGPALSVQRSHCTLCTTFAKIAVSTLRCSDIIYLCYNHSIQFNIGAYHSLLCLPIAFLVYLHNEWRQRLNLSYRKQIIMTMNGNKSPHTDAQQKGATLIDGSSMMFSVFVKYNDDRWCARYVQPIIWCRAQINDSTPIDKECVIVVCNQLKWIRLWPQAKWNVK